ncbi:MAG: serine hydrolase domain-containing protein [Ruminococcus sp.]|nr:serine hydrolase domain-containing protein [Ruminococcus sp.]
MKKTVALILSALIILTSAACSAQNSSTADTTAPATTAPLKETTGDSAEQQMLNEKLEEFGFEGTVYAAKGGKAYATYANGTLDNGKDITIDTPMPVGSVSKQFCAASILLLQEQGKLSVKDTLGKYFPECSYGEKVTLHHMLSMRSGIPEIIDKKEQLQYEAGMDKTEEENIAAFKKWVFAQELDFEPDTSFAYSNSNFMLLGLIVEQVSGKSYIDFLHDNIFTPLGMKHSGTIHELKDSPEWANGVTHKAENLSPGIEPGMAKGAGDIVSTGEDITIWLNALSSGKLISKESYKTMTTDYTDSTSHYGYGLYVEFSGGVGHFGNIGTYTAADYLNENTDVTLFVATCSMSSGTLINIFTTLVTLI